MTTEVPTPSAGSKKEAIVHALMRLAAERTWSEIEITHIARAANVSLAEFRDLFPSKGAVLEAFSRMIDRQVLDATTSELAAEPARERIFDVMMRRLDALTPYKRALKRIAHGFDLDPFALAALNRSAVNSQRFMLAAAAVPTEGALGGLKLQGAAIVFAKTMRTWLRDDDPALARTMARLDRELRRGERFLQGADDFCRLTAPFRALGRACFRPGYRHDETRGRGKDGEASNPASAI
ncbi:TetR/AcrR family transcriptional regulator [Microvirga flavescens]|uniref:TetR/AcrR family transcriptional regulator n=1 Tax=Microvirga flavescens TaxID=2249811 RepID=UPI0018E0BACA|nr:TetR/AcrR family transcriptional regulator [Microvirga flavescens]